VKDIGVSAEELAALLDGRLDQSRRAELLARLGSSDEALEAYANAASVVSELEAGDTARSTAPSKAASRAHPRRLPAWSWVAMAAALAGVVVAPWLWTRARSVDREDPGRFADLVSAPGHALPPQWYGTPWPGTRGAGEPLSATARAVRLGVRLVDLELAVRTRDTTLTRLTAEIVDLVEGLPAGSPVAEVYRDVARRASSGASTDALETTLERGRHAVSKLAGPDFVKLGAWAEAGRIGARQHNGDFLTARENRSMLEWALSSSSLPQAANALLQQLHSNLQVNSPPDWNNLERDFAELLKVTGS
jgi:hypothetical protein